MLFARIIKIGRKNPKQLFLIDGLGAGLSAFLLAVVLVRLEHIFGIPPAALYFLALLPCMFAAYDFYCFAKAKALNISSFLQGISLMNIGYVVLSIGVALYHHSVLTYYGWLYIALESVVVLFLASIQYRVAKQM
ncbi:MAG: hypothetical protein JJT94_11515 [Bernardetiaceae bacterium]|nr:hypothetical protein [Bernardetiaceae bacterium]